MTGIVLVADNVELTGRFLRWKLENRFPGKLQVKTGGDGGDAVEMAAELLRAGLYQDVILIILGCHMPGVSGPQATAEIRRLENEHSNNNFRATIIGSSADMCDETAVSFQRAGADYAVWKPVEPAMVEHMCEEILIDRSVLQRGAT
jgi:CheY-like chemotaxis protein